MPVARQSDSSPLGLRGAAHTSVAAQVASWRPSATLSPVERYGRFEILGRIGRGGMAEILLARERSPAGGARHLVIKRVLPEIQDNDEMRNLFLAEARVVMGLFHPNLCQIYEVGEQDGTWFIAMEWVNGATLHQLLRRAVSERDIDYAVMARVVSLAAEALHHAHTARDAEGRPLHLVHRDVSPHNVMVGYDGRVKLLDFGIAKSTKSTHQTEAGVVKGKVCYMSPEQWLSGPLDARTDVFALGACLYEALTGTVVFKRETQSEVMRAVIQEGAPLLSEVAPDVPLELATIAHRALAFDPAERFQSAQEMSEALELFLSTLSQPLPASKVAGYVRRLFRAEVELGPLLERTVRGAHLPSYDVVLPPLPPALLGLPKLTPSMMGLPDNDPAPVQIMGGTSHLPSPGLQRPSLPTRPDLDSRLGFEDLTQSAERPVSEPSPELPAELPEARPALKTVSLPVQSRTRRALLLALPVGAALAFGFWSYQRSLPTPRPVAVSQVAPAAAPRPEPPPVPVQAPVAEPPQAAEQLLMPAAEADDADDKAPERAGHSQARGRLSINTRPWSTVYLGARVLGTTPLADVTVPRGTLSLRLVDRDGNVHVRKVARSRKAERIAFYDLEAPKKRAKRAK